MLFRSTAGISANGGYGTAGQILASNGSSVYWTADQTAGNISAVGVTTNSLTANYISITTGTLTVGNSTVNSTVNTSVLQIANTTGTANITPTSIFMGNSTVNCVINSTSVYVNGVDYNPTTALAIAVALS